MNKVKKNPAETILNLTAVLVVGGSALIFPELLGLSESDWWLRLSSLIMFATSWNLMANAGLISLGHSAFWGMGGYACILISNFFSVSFWIVIPCTMVCGAVLGAGLAVITGRLRGLYFSVGTLALSEGLRVFTVMVPSLTGGGEGLYLDPRFFLGYQILTIVGLAGASGAVLISLAISKSSYQFALRAMRSNEGASMMIGVNPLRFRIIITAVSGGIASMAGCLTAYATGFLDPGTAFDLHLTIIAQVAPILGGMYTVAGPIIGALITNMLADFTRIVFGDVHGLAPLMFGTLLIVGIIFMPQGVVGIWKTMSEGRFRSEHGAENDEVREATE
jgi:branched-chain amino acid transport system permease protein